MKMVFKGRLFVSTCLLIGLLHSFHSSAQSESSPLYERGWQLSALDGIGFKSENSPYFIFDEKGNVYGYGICNYLIGKFKSETSDEFLLTKLKRSNAQCEEEDEEIETKLMAAMLMSNRIQIDEAELTLMSDDQATVGFIPKQDVNRAELMKAAEQVQSSQVKHPVRNKLKKGSTNKKKQPVKKSSKSKQIHAPKVNPMKVKASPKPKSRLN
jgi:heat shock protein HslJ